MTADVAEKRPGVRAEPPGGLPEASTAREPVAAAPSPGLVRVPLHLIRVGQHRLRKRLEPESLRSLAQSIRDKGVAQPVLLRRSRAPHEGQFELVAGYRRVVACSLANYAAVPALILDLAEDREALELALAENLQRQDLTVIEEAEAYQTLIDVYGHTHHDVARIAGKSRSHVTNVLRLLGLPDEVKELVQEGLLTFGHARALLGADDPESLAQEAIAEALTVRALEGRVQATPYRTPPDGAPGPADREGPGRAAAASEKRAGRSAAAGPEPSPEQGVVPMPQPPSRAASPLERTAALVALESRIGAAVGLKATVTVDAIGPCITLRGETIDGVIAAAKTIAQALETARLDAALGDCCAEPGEM